MKSRLDLSSDKVGIGSRLAKPYDPNAPKPEPVVEQEEIEEVEAEVEEEVKVEAQTPASKPVAKPVDKKKEMVLPPGVLRWGDQSVAGFKGARIQQCIIYQIVLAKNPFWTLVINGGRGYLSQPEVITKLVGDTPEDFVWDEDGVIGWKRRHVDGEDKPVVSKVVQRKPRNEAERQLIRNSFGVTPHTRKLLALENCKLCHGKGSYKVRPYDDNPHLTAHVECQCPYEDDDKKKKE